MEEHYRKYVPEEVSSKVLVCDVGPDTYHSSKNKSLIDQCRNWVRKNQQQLGVREHDKKL